MSFAALISSVSCFLSTSKDRISSSVRCLSTSSSCTRLVHLFDSYLYSTSRCFSSDSVLLTSMLKSFYLDARMLRSALILDNSNLNFTFSSSSLLDFSSHCDRVCSLRLIYIDCNILTCSSLFRFSSTSLCLYCSSTFIRDCTLDFSCAISS
mgnify:FL=1